MKKRMGLGLAALAFVAALTWAASNTIAEERTAEGTYLQLDMMGMMDVHLGDNHRIYDLGPGAYLAVGHNWGMFGARAGFHYAALNGRQDGPNLSFLESNLFGGTFDLKFLPLGKRESMFQPYLVAGLGPQYIEYKVAGAESGDWGLVGNTGIGFDLFLTDQFALNLETNLRPSLFVQTRPGDNSNYDEYFYSFMGGFTFYFDKPEKAAAPVVAAAPVAAAPVVAEHHYVAGEKIALSGEIFFKTASAEIHPDSYPELDHAVSVMKAHPEILVLEIEGHTDNRGADAYNMTLSQKRAESVRKYFVSKGIAADRLTAKGYGETKPLVPNDSPANMAKNRRIDFRVAKFK